MKIRPDVVLTALDSLIEALAPATTCSLAGVVSRVCEHTGIEVPTKVVRAALDELALAGECEVYKAGREVSVRRFTKDQRDGWKLADSLAAQLGGTAERFLDERIAGVSLTLEQARALADRLVVAEGSYETTISTGTIGKKVA